MNPSSPAAGYVHNKTYISRLPAQNRCDVQDANRQRLIAGADIWTQDWSARLSPSPCSPKGEQGHSPRIIFRAARACPGQSGGSLEAATAVGLCALLHSSTKVVPPAQPLRLRSNSYSLPPSFLSPSSFEYRVASYYLVSVDRVREIRPADTSCASHYICSAKTSSPFVAMADKEIKEGDQGGCVLCIAVAGVCLETWARSRAVMRLLSHQAHRLTRGCAHPVFMNPPLLLSVGLVA